MTVKEEWYTLDLKRDIQQNNSIESNKLTLTIERLGLYAAKSEIFARAYNTSKYSVIKVPNSQLQLKLVFIGSGYMETYWRTVNKSKLRQFIKLDLLIYNTVPSFNTVSSTVKKGEQSFEYSWVQANKWQKCGCITLPDYSSGIKLFFTFDILLSARLNNSPKPTTQQELVRDFVNFLTNTDDSNYGVTIKSVEGEEFKVHKDILAVRCKVLKAHFEHNTEESNTNIVETPWEAKVLREVLIFLNTGSSPGIDDEPEKILAAADFYQLEGLKGLCVETMIDNLTVDNAIGTLQVALLHSVDTLRDQTLQFIKDGHARLITQTDAWANVPNEILKIIYECITADEKISYNIIAEAHEECKQNKLV